MTQETKQHVSFSIKSVADDSYPHGAFEAILSTPDLDRDGEIIDAFAFSPLPASVPVYSDHETQTLRSIVGRAVPTYDDSGRLRLKGVFFSGEWAQQVRAMVNEGICDTMSAGFFGARKSVDGRIHIYAGELIEGSFVGIPANPNALVLSSKSLSDDEAAETIKAILELLDNKSGARNARTDQSRLDQAHEMIVAAGANCPPLESDGKGMKLDPEAKAAAGTDTDTETETLTETETETPEVMAANDPEDFDLLDLEIEIAEAELALADVDDEVDGTAI